MKHFELNIKDKASNHINKEYCVGLKPNKRLDWDEDMCVRQRARVALNYDLNMRYFASLDLDAFNKHLEQQCAKFKLMECKNLNDLAGIEGVYVLVLDSYKQVYIGQSSDIKQRITSHWNGKKSLDRMIYGRVFDSILSIDSFGALDTTRIFYLETYNTYLYEEKMVASFSSLYLLNRTAGGIGCIETNSETKELALLSVASNQKTRSLVEFVNQEELNDAFKVIKLHNFYFETAKISLQERNKLLSMLYEKPDERFNWY